jgi:hypothetical protein
MARLLQKRFPEQQADYSLGVTSLAVTEPSLAEPVIKKDAIMLLKKIFKFNVHHLRIDQKALLKDDVSMEQKVKLEYILSHDALSEDYSVLKTIEEELLTFLIKAMHQPHIDAEIFHPLKDEYEAIERMMYAAKARKDQESELFELFQSDSPFIHDRLLEMKKHMIQMYLKIADIIDNDAPRQNYDKVVGVFQQITYDNKKFLEEISTYLQTNTLDKGSLTKLFHLSQSWERSNAALL